jgi:hypothetical protein
MAPEIIYTRWGLATNYGNHIELNEGLKSERWAKLRERLIAHELQHTRDNPLSVDIEGFNEDMRLDPDAMLFILLHPTSLTSVLPFDSEGKVYWFDLIMWLTLSSIIAVGWYANPIKLLQGGV